MDAGGGNQRVLATSTVNSLDCKAAGPAWSPDGTRLAYTTNETCSNRIDMWVVPVDGASPAVRLLPADSDGQFPAWSPNGRRIAFLGTDTDTSIDVSVVDVPAVIPAAGLPVHRLGPGSVGPLMDAQSGPRWSPDGTEVAADNGTHIYDDSTNDGFSILKADGSGERLSVPGAHNPEWSPDGKRLAFHRRVDKAEYFNDRPCTVRFWVIGADGSGGRQLDPLADGCGEGPLWSPDGTRLTGSLITATPTQPDVAFHVGVVPVDGGSAPVILPDGISSRWQPVIAPLPGPRRFRSARPFPETADAVRGHHSITTTPTAGDGSPLVFCPSGRISVERVVVRILVATGPLELDLHEHVVEQA